MYFQAPEAYNGPQISVANSASAPVTTAMLKEAFWGADKTAYQAGKTLWFIPVIPENQIGSIAKLPGAADLPIWGVVVGASPLTSATGLDSPSLDALNNYQTGNPKRLTIAHRGCGRIFVAKYTGTAPDPTSATTRFRYVVTSATGGSVAIPSTDAIAESSGAAVLAVSTALSMVAFML
jgi:hypothetical protein